MLLHGVPSFAAGLEQTPVPASHVPATWHWSLAVQTTGLEPVHTPDWHVSVCVQAFWSLQGVLSGADGLVHMPVAGLQVPAMWHWSLAVQATGLEPLHTPAWHVSVCVQGFPSLQAVPFVLGGLEQPVAGLHVPATWHWSLAVHTMGFEGVHVPP
jgi:hypothetical protein